MLQKVKDFFLALLRRAQVIISKVVNASKEVWKFLRKWGFQIINLIVLFVAYDFYSDSLLVGLWLFLLLAYYLFYKLLGGEKLFEKDDEDGLPI